jgi:hypothetical protein
MVTTPCVIAPGKRRRDGRVTAWFQGRNQYAHRVAWVKAFGPLTPDQKVCHHCDNPPCIALDHLFIGTDADNVADKVAKGRHPHGSRNYNSKITEADALTIRSMVSQGWSQAFVAMAFALDPSSVSHLIRGKTWRHTRS